MLLVFRGGLGAAFADARDALLRRVARRRGIAVPALTGTVDARDGRTDAGRPDRADRPTRRLQVRGARGRARRRARARRRRPRRARGRDRRAARHQRLGEVDAARHGRRACTDRVRGRVTIDGVDTTRTRAERIVALGVAEAPADHGVFPSLTVRENLRLAGWRVRDRAASRAALADALDLFPRLDERAGQRAGDLSGGEQHMLTLAMALVAAPRLLLVDELSLGLSPEATRRVQERLRALRDAGVAIVVVEQSIDRAIELADRAVFLDGGTVRYTGPPAGLLDRPDLVRATFLGAAAAVTVDTRARAARDRARRPTALPALELRDVRVRFGGVDALAGVSLTVARGEIVGVIGPNGAGKTTLFDVVSGLRAARRGHDRAPGRSRRGPARGRDRASRRTHARALGLGRSFQDGRLFPALTVRETIAVACERAVRVRNPIAAALHLPAVARSEARSRARVDELVELLHLGPYADRFGHELSTGTRRIVDLACVLAHEPAVLLLDEPAAGVAQREAEALGPLLTEVRDSLDAAVLVIEHDLGVLGDVADRLVALDLGRVVAAGPPDRGPDRSRRHRRVPRPLTPPGTPRRATIAPCVLPATSPVPWPAHSSRVVVAGTLVGTSGAGRRRDPGARRRAADLRPGQGAGQGRRLGPELRHHHREGRGAERLRAAVRRAVEGRRQRRRHRTGRHRRHHHRRALPGPARSPAAGVLREHAGATRAWPRSATPPRTTSTTSPRTTSCTGARSSWSPMKASGAPDDAVAAKADAIKVATELHAFASFGGPGQTTAYADELAARRRALRRRLRDRRAAVVPRTARAVRVADDRVTRAGERALGRVRRQAARQGQGRVRGRRAEVEATRVRRRPLRRRRGHVRQEREALRAAAWRRTA